MKKKLLLVTEDIVEIQTFSGKLGNLYSYLYQLMIKMKLNLVIIALHFKYDITVLATNSNSTKFASFFTYSEQFDPKRMVEYKVLIEKIFEFIANTISKIDKEFSQFKSIPLISLWKNKINSRVMNYYLSYLELLDRLIAPKTYSHVLILGNSKQEQIAKYLCKKYNLKLLSLTVLNFNFITKIFFRYFRQREMSKKLKIFKKQALKPNLISESLNGSVLLSVDFFRHLKILIPVYRKLSQLKAKSLFIADELLIKTYLKNFKAEDSKYIFLANFLSVDDIDKKIIQWKPSVANIYRQITKSIKNNPVTTESLILKLAFPEISPIIKQGLVLAKLYLLAGEKLFKTIKPKYIVVAADLRLSELTLAYLAELHKVPSITVSPRTIIFEDEPYQYNQTDYISVAGPFAKNQLNKLGASEQKVIVNGDPSYDYFNFLSKKFSADKTLRKLNIKTTKKKIILLISDRPNLYLPKEEKKAFFLLVSRAIENHPDKILVIKPHPTEKRYRLLEELNQWGITNAIISDNQKIELFDLLKLSSVIVMVWSMTGLESMILKKPVIIVNPHHKNFDKFIPYLKNKAAVVANNSNILSKYLNIYTDHENPQTKKLISSGLHFSEKYIKKPDGKAALRVAKFILK